MGLIEVDKNQLLTNGYLRHFSRNYKAFVVMFIGLFCTDLLRRDGVGFVRDK